MTRDMDAIMADVTEALSHDPDYASKLPTAVVATVVGGALATHGTGFTEPVTMREAHPPEPPPNPQERVITIPEPGTEPYWYEPVEDARLFDHVVMSRRKLGSRLPGGLLITGPAGSGKTRGVSEGIARLNREHELSIPLLVMNCPTITDPQKWFGRREVDGKGTHYVESEFVKAVREGWVILLDEFMRLRPEIHNTVMSLFDGTESVLINDLGVRVDRHPETMFIGTMNEGVQYSGQGRMDWAMRERWSTTIERTFPPDEEEVRVLTSAWPGCSPEAAGLLVIIAKRTRDMWQDNNLRVPISTRTLANAAYLVASGYTEVEALLRTALPEYDGGAEGTMGKQTERDMVKSIIEGKFATGNFTFVPKP